MTFDPGLAQKEDLRLKAEKISRLQELIQEYPAEAQLIMTAIEDGLTLGAIQVVDASANGLSWV